VSSRTDWAIEQHPVSENKNEKQMPYLWLAEKSAHRLLLLTLVVNVMILGDPGFHLNISGIFLYQKQD
jgi:hypothetical protein